MPKSEGERIRLPRPPKSVESVKNIQRGHPHESLIFRLLNLPREDVHSIARVVMAVWDMEDRAKKVAKARRASRRRITAAK